jgi:hypothetical protein
LSTPRIASGPQIWRLNEQGRLQITDQAGPSITAAAAHELISELAAGSALDPTDEFLELDQQKNA